MKAFSLAAIAAVTFSVLPASAQNARTWISGAGADGTGCGPVANPCRTLQHAHNVTNAGGEINVRDGAGYGSLIVTKAITIINDGVGVAGVLAPSGGNAIEINAGASDDVVLRGLTIEGARVGARGIVFNTGGSLSVANCLVQNFAGSNPAGNGILIQPTSGTPKITISNTTASYNATFGILYSPPGGSVATATIEMDHVVANNNQLGIKVEASSTTQTTAVISNSIASNNSNTGFSFSGSQTAALDNSTASGNTFGVAGTGSNTKVYVGRSVITGNGTGVTTSTALFYSYRDNRIDGNTTDVSGNLIQATAR